MKQPWSKKEITQAVKLHKQGLSRKKIAQALNSNFKTTRTGDSVKHCLDSHVNNEDPKPLKILLFDLETSPITGRVWGLFDQNISLNQIVSDWHLMSWAAKWLGDPESSIMYMDQSKVKNVGDDYKIVKALWKLLDDSDIVLAHNANSFDVKKINARFAHYKLPPPSSYKVIDTLRIAKRHFAFTSNKLEYLTNKFCVKYRKSLHKQFSGFDLWKECLNGNKKAWKEMKDYNILDVLAMEELYLNHLMKWDKTINFNNLSGGVGIKCNCGSTRFNLKGFRYTKNARFKKLACSKCGAELEEKEKK